MDVKRSDTGEGPDACAKSARGAARLAAIDHGRGASVLAMMLVHALWMYGRSDVQESPWFGALVHTAGRGTGMFLLAMGFSFVLSRRQHARAALVRGTQILALGYLMNALKFVVPYALGFMPESFVEAYGFHSPLGARELGFMLLTGDILQLAGLSLLVLPLLGATTDRPRVQLVLALTLPFASELVCGLRPGVPGLDYLCDLLWGREYDVYFPVFPWFSLILFGSYLGLSYRAQACDERRLFARMLGLGLVLSALGLTLCSLDRQRHLRDFFHGGPGSALASMGISSLLFWLAHRLTPWLGAGPLGRLLRHASRHVTALYVIQWVLVCWGMGLVGYHRQGALAVVGLSLLVGLASFGLLALWRMLAARRGRTRVDARADAHELAV